MATKARPIKRKHGPPPGPAATMAGRLVGRYRIVSKLGQGGMATVWRAEDTLLHRPVALKILSENLTGVAEAEHRFLREARAASAISHPSVAAVYDVGRSADFFYIAFACVEGETVSERAARTPFTHGDAVALGLGVAGALEHAHARGILHRDITGRNIMVDREGQVFVLDFGLAWVAGTIRMTSSRATLGTCAYISPEVAAGHQADERSDLYGLGVVLYEALTGTLPHRGDVPATLLYAAMHTAVEAPSLRRAGLDPALERVVLRLLEKQPELRFQTSAELAAALMTIGVPGGHATPSERPSTAAPVSGTSHGIAVATSAMPETVYLAVLPFEDLGSSEDAGGTRAAFAQGLASALAAGLARFTEIHIVPVLATPPDTATGDLEGMARALGANLLLRGSVRRAGTQVRVSYGLWQPYRRLQIAGETLDGSVFDLFDLEDRLAASVIRSLGLEAPGAPLAARSGGRDPAARERFVQALGYLQRSDNEAHVDAAIALLERLERSEPESAAIHAALGRGCLFKYRLSSERAWEARGASACQRALELDAESPDVLLTLGHLGVSTGRFEEAIGHYRRSLGLRKNSHEALIGLARACEELGRFAEATRYCDEAIALRPGYWGGHAELGQLLVRQGRFEHAIEPWRKVVALCPDNQRGYVNLSRAYFDLGQYEDALGWCHQSIEVHPTAAAYSNMGTILYYLDRYDEAADAFQKAVGLRPADAKLLGNLGSTCMWIPARREQANEVLDQAIGLVRERLGRNPGQAEDWVQLSGWLANRGRHAEARDALVRGLALFPQDTTFLARAGVISHQIGDRAKALTYLGEAVSRGYSAKNLMRDPYLAGLRGDPSFEALNQGAVSTQGGQKSREGQPNEEGRDA